MRSIAALIGPSDHSITARAHSLYPVGDEPAERRLALRRERSAPLVAELEAWMRTERTRLSRHAPVAKAMDYMLKRWESFTRFLDDGRICLTNNGARADNRDMPRLDPNSLIRLTSARNLSA